MRSIANGVRLSFLAKRIWIARPRALGLLWGALIVGGVMVSWAGDRGVPKPAGTNAGGTVVLGIPLLKTALRVDGGMLGKNTSIAIENGGVLTLNNVEVTVPIEVLPGGRLEITGSLVAFKAPACLLVRSGGMAEVRCPIEVAKPVENSGTINLYGGDIRCPSAPGGAVINEPGGIVVSNRAVILLGSAAITDPLATLAVNRTSGTNRLLLTGTSGQAYVIQASPTFWPGDWTNISGVLTADAAGTIAFTDTNPPLTRFYRLRQAER